MRWRGRFPVILSSRACPGVVEGSASVDDRILNHGLRRFNPVSSPEADPSTSLRFAQDDLGFLATLFFLALIFFSSAHADVTGTVTIQGAPNSKDETFYARAANCGESPVRHTENWKIGPKGELADVVVWIVNPSLMTDHGVPPPPEIEITQIGCRYVPHVIAVKAGVPFKVINGDPTLHNIRAKVYDPVAHAAGADVFNFGQSYQGQTDEQQFDTPGIYTLQCDVHAWMQAWVRVLDNFCFAVTDASGSFKIQQGADLNDGDYKIDAWHPKFDQPLEQTVHVKNGTATVTFQFDGTKSF
jgi:plastocyanin